MSDDGLGAARARHAKNVRLCAGPCGRMTRSSKVPGHLFPETVTRYNGQLCTTCHTLAREQEMIASGETPPPRGPSPLVRKELPPERVAQVAEQISKFTASRRARLARKGWFLHGPTGLPAGMGGHRVASIRSARSYRAPGTEQERTG